jgi:hypothetical protein
MEAEQFLDNPRRLDTSQPSIQSLKVDRQAVLVETELVQDRGDDSRGHRSRLPMYGRVMRTVLRLVRPTGLFFSWNGLL